MCIASLGFIGCFLLLAAGRVMAADEPEWKVGLAQAKITPERPLFLAGYASRNKPFEKVETDLYVKALVLEDRQGHRGGAGDQRPDRLPGRRSPSRSANASRPRPA